MRTRTIIVSLTISLLVFAALGVKDKTVLSEEVAERQPSSEPGVEIKPPEFDPKNSDTYQFDRRMKAVLNGKEILTDIQYSGYLFVDWKEIGKEKRKVTFSFQVKDAPTPPVFAEVELSSDYSLLQMKTSVPWDENSENSILFLKDLVSIYAFKTFEDTTGKYEASLKLVSDDQTEKIFAKKKIKYENGEFARLKFNKSIHEFHVKDRLEEASGFEDTQMGNEIKTSGVYQLKKMKASEVLQLGIKRALPDPAAPLVASSLKTNPNQVITKKATWEELEKKLALLGSLTGRARLALFHELVKEMKKDPGHLQAFMNWMKAGMNDRGKVSMGIGILATVADEKSQHELVQLYREVKSDSPETAHLILNAFASKSMKPTPEAIGMLNGILDQRKENPELAANAAYALGASGEVKKITELAEQATAKSEKIIYIDAMGNSGSNEVLPYLLESVKSADPQIREKAIFALRFVNDGRVKSVFEQSMNDVSPGVRHSVVRAVPFQPNPRDYEAMLQNCANRSSEAQLKNLCSETLASF